MRFELHVIRVATPKAHREYVVGDTLERFAELQRASGERAAVQWLKREMWRVLLRAPHHRSAVKADAASSFSLESLLDDVRYAVRSVKREPILSAAIVIVLALALGLNATTFRIMDATLFQGFPLVKDNERLLFVDERYPTPACCVTYADYEVWKAEARSFEDLAFGVMNLATVSEGAAARDIQVAATTANTFGLLGVAPVLGRDFNAADEAPGAEPVAVVSHRYWTSRLGARGDVVGSVVHVDGAPVTVVGVLPDGFNWPAPMDVWRPLVQTAALREVVGNGSYAFGRLAPGTTEEAAQAELEALNARLALERPTTNRDVRPVVNNFMNSFAGYNATLIYGSLWAGAWLVLAIACANLTNLALARAHARTREISTRIALGAGRGRVARQWLVESVLLAAVAAVLAWVGTVWSTRLWSAATATWYRVHDYTPSFGTLAYLAAVALGAAVIITLPPIARLRNLDVNGSLKGESRGTTIGRGAKRLSAALVAGQMTLAVVLMSAAGVLTHSVWNVLTAPIGVHQPENVLIGRLQLPRANYPTRESRAAYFESLRARLVETPGVSSATVASARPTEDYEPRPVELETDVGSLRGAPVLATAPAYFETLGVPVMAGRDFDFRDVPSATQVAIVNQSFAETHFPGRNPIGERIRLYENRASAPGEWLTIVGVVGNVMQNDTFRQRFMPVVYRPFAQEPVGTGWFFVRAPNVFDGLAAAVRERAASVDAGLEIVDFGTLEGSLGFRLTHGREEYSALSRHAAVSPVFAGLALLLAAVGLYAVVVRSVGQRVQEIGVRIALGAAPRAIRLLVLFEGMRPVLVGVLSGFIASLGVNRVLQSQLVSVSPFDGLTVTLAPMVLIVVAVVGCVLPLRHGFGTSPIQTLKHN